MMKKHPNILRRFLLKRSGQKYYAVTKFMLDSSFLKGKKIHY